jgi:hypothetical protein
MFAVLGYLTLYLPGLLLGSVKIVTGDELAETYPAFAGTGGMFFYYNILSSFLWWLCYGMVIYFFQNEAGIIIFAGTFCTGLNVANGLFAIKTGACPAPIWRNSFFVFDTKVQRVSQLQFISGLIEIALALCLVFVPVSVWSKF